MDHIHFSPGPFGKIKRTRQLVLSKEYVPFEDLLEQGTYLLVRHMLDENKKHNEATVDISIKTQHHPTDDSKRILLLEWETFEKENTHDTTIRTLT